MYYFHNHFKKTHTIVKIKFTLFFDAFISLKIFSSNGCSFDLTSGSSKYLLSKVGELLQVVDEILASSLGSFPTIVTMSSSLTDVGNGVSSFISDDLLFVMFFIGKRKTGFCISGLGL